MFKVGDSAFIQRLFLIRNQKIQIDFLDDADALAFRARAHRRVEGKQTRFEFRYGKTADFARVARGKEQRIVRRHDRRHAFAEIERRIDGIVVAAAVIAFNDSVDNDFNRVLLIFSSGSSSSIRRISPSTRARRKPSFISLANVSLNVPFLSRAIGARTVVRVPSGRSITRLPSR